MPKVSALVAAPALQASTVEPEPASLTESTDLIRRDVGGPVALAMMPQAEFEARLIALKLGKERVRRIQKEMMTEDEDYGVIPGTKKPTLLKPGAETLCHAYGLVPTFVTDHLQGDGVTTPHLRVLANCYLHVGTDQGPIVGEGIGAANSWERKHRYRTAARACPSCGVEGSIRRSKFADRETGDTGWYCHNKVGGCGAKFPSNDPAILEQQGGQVENPDPYDVENTLFKMAAKRAQIDAVLRTTATSGLFTQDIEELSPNGDGPAAHHAEPPQPAARMPQDAQSAAAQPEPGQDSPHITPAQLKRLWAVLRKSGRELTAVHDWLRANWGWSSTNDIRQSAYDEIIAALESPDALPPGSHFEEAGDSDQPF